MSSLQANSILKPSMLGAALLLGTLNCTHIAADSLPFRSGFDADSIGKPPIALKQAHRPTILYTEEGSSILVQESANGVNTQPTVITVNNDRSWATMVYLFYPISDRIVRVEATTSLNRFASGYFAETSTVRYGPLVTRLLFMTDGTIMTETQERQNVGRYRPNSPFRIRMDIDIPTQSYAVTIDPKMNGFHDDTTHENLAFTNSHIYLGSVGAAYFSLNTFPVEPIDVTSIAYDDIYIGVIHATEELYLIEPPLATAAIQKRSASHDN